MEKSTINQRIQLIMKRFDLNSNSMARKLGASQTQIYNIADPKGRGSAPSFRLLQSIAEHFNVNTDWLLTGRGQMMHSDVNLNVYPNVYPISSDDANPEAEATGPPVAEEPTQEYESESPPAPDHEALNDLWALINEKDHMVQTLHNQNRRLLRMIITLRAELQRQEKESE